MYTSLAVAALAGVVFSPGHLEFPNVWLNDYALARVVGKQVGKPLAVVVSSGEKGYQNLHGSPMLSTQVAKLLEEKYVRVYVDKNSPAGSELAQRFQITQTVGIILSNGSGEFQSFHHDGIISEADLQTHLARHSDPRALVTNTQTLGHSGSTSTTTSFYPPANPDGPILEQPGLVSPGSGPITNTLRNIIPNISPITRNC